MCNCIFSLKHIRNNHTLVFLAERNQVRALTADTIRLQKT